MLSQNICAMSVVVMKRNLFLSCVLYNTINFNGYFPEIETMNPVSKIDNNSACGHPFLLKLLQFFILHRKDYPSMLKTQHR